MEQYPIPQFIEAEGKIAFFLSFKQFFYLAGAGVICFMLYYIVKPFALFMVIAFILFAGAIVLAFVSINGVPILNLILGSLGFAMGGKDFTWKKKESPYPFKSIKRAHIARIDKGPVLKAQQSQLKRTKTDIELRTK